MRKTNNARIFLCLNALFLLTFAVSPTFAQSGRRSISSARSDVESPTDMSNTVEVKYEGGILGINKTAKGNLVLDAANKRILFKDKNGNDLFSVPYSSVIAAYADSRKKTPFLASAAANAVPYGGGLPALLIKNKARFLVIHYKEADTDLQGIVTFKFKQKGEIAPRLETLVRDSGLTARENIYVRVKTPV
ncbi:MAG: hypothetical protein H7Z37_12635, partial [Pyrinomonadaceae bacterium]|nr:hypothetical protein [Pyrinomonadaceae bacterium]